jgi:hypothetical protein
MGPAAFTADLGGCGGATAFEIAHLAKADMRVASVADMFQELSVWLSTIRGL